MIECVSACIKCSLDGCMDAFNALTSVMMHWTHDILPGAKNNGVTQTKMCAFGNCFVITVNLKLPVITVGS